MMHTFCCPALENTEIKFVKGVGPVRAGQFARLGVKTAADLLEFYPRDYIDFSSGGPFSAAGGEDTAFVIATVVKPAVRIPTHRSGMTLYKLTVADDEGAVGTLVFFNAQYAAEQLAVGQRYCFSGQVESPGLGKGYEIRSPKCCPLDGSAPLIAPVYPQTNGLTSAAVSRIVSRFLEGALDGLEDPIPDDVRAQYSLCTLAFALRNIHFPRDAQALETARSRLIFGELLCFDLVMHKLKKENRSGSAPVIGDCDMQPFYASLPFEMTGAQKKAVAVASADMAQAVPMSRLLQGDVGSGKTVVCAALMYRAVRAGYQAALMAPTELLALQHQATLSKLLAPLGIRTALLTGSTKTAERRTVLAGLADGSISIAVGTHALFSDAVEYAALALVVTDEQHRFGVRQRSKLAAKGESPHFYVMSATPIPRTLALMLYGDLDLSVLDVLPGGRRPIKTYIYEDPNRERLFGFIQHELDRGRQAFIVCPAIEENETGKLAAVTYYEEQIQPHFGAYRTALLHGRMPAAEKDAVMKAFVAGETALLVSTTVIEVGIDVPNATVMVIENADCFGLAQLHQLRGRVGRGAEESYCVLVVNDCPQGAPARLRIIKNSSSGFDIAEADLKLRGPGDFLGERQSGVPLLKLAGSLTDSGAIAAARNAADRMADELSPAMQRLIAGITGEIASGGLN